MATHSVRAGGGVKNISKTSHADRVQTKEAGEQFATDPIDVSHLRQISEGVLHRAGLHDGIAHDGSVRDLRGDLEGAVDIDPDELPSTEPHVQLLRLQKKFGGIVERRVNTDGSIVLALIHGDGDITTAKAATTYAALDGLIEKMGGLD